MNHDLLKVLETFELRNLWTRTLNPILFFSACDFFFSLDENDYSG